MTEPATAAHSTLRDVILQAIQYGDRPPGNTHWIRASDRVHEQMVDAVLPAVHTWLIDQGIDLLEFRG